MPKTSAQLESQQRWLSKPEYIFILPFLLSTDLDHLTLQGGPRSERKEPASSSKVNSSVTFCVVFNLLYLLYHRNRERYIYIDLLRLPLLTVHAGAKPNGMLPFYLHLEQRHAKIHPRIENARGSVPHPFHSKLPMIPPAPSQAQSLSRAYLTRYANFASSTPTGHII
jgi:hypothetical protein